jgi:hypothetical protein
LNDKEVQDKERKIETSKEGDITFNLLKPSFGILKCVAKNNVGEETAICNIKTNGIFF